MGKKLDNKFLDRVEIFLCLSEKLVACLGFPNLEGKLDYVGFKSEDEVAVEWAKALFTYYWNQSTSQIPEQLLGK